MEKILLIGKRNELITGLYEYLRYEFNVKLCIENEKDPVSMIKVIEPALTVVFLVGTYEIDVSTFKVLAREYPQMPVLTIGTQTEYDNLTTHFKEKKYENILRPFDNEAVQKRIFEVLYEKKRDSEIKDQKNDTRKQILIVDDDALSLRGIKAMLDDRYRVTLANSGMKAMTAIGKDRPDLILLDYEMPIMDGRQTLEMIKADEEIKNIPVIFLTGVSDRAHIEAVIKLGTKGYLLKPVASQLLLESIEKVLN